ncbi:hypothetical protein CSAL01_11297 [Colletotrichum salicis]|uniref:Ig-like domain-containing protein n=1 Tax=Colletotrichum salicis TaxID=1209931 RepID=A0A135TL13_9PEZI|nr:hypothetical protein CSAL01_11297 [Colletotrichum salicis]
MKFLTVIGLLAVSVSTSTSLHSPETFRPSASNEELITYSAFTPSENLFQTISKPMEATILTSETKHTISISPGTSLVQSSTSESVAPKTSITISKESQVQLPSTADDAELHSTTSDSSSPTPTSTMATMPPSLFLQTLTNATWKTNICVTKTASDGSPTVFPVLVGCPGCGGVSGGGILVWNLPTIPNVSIKTPGFPNLPQFSLPCIKVLGMQLGNCPGPVTEISSDRSEEGDGDVQSSHNTYPDQLNEQSCTVTNTVSNCVVTCSPKPTGSTSIVTCFTTACHKTITGCSVSGTTTTTKNQPCPTNTGGGTERRDVEDESCAVACPGWIIIHNPELDDFEGSLEDDVVLERATIAGRLLMPRAEPAPVLKIGDCKILNAWPQGQRLSIPGYPSGEHFVAQEKLGFPGVDDARKASLMSITRWYSTTTAPAPICTVEVKGLLKELLATTISEDAVSLDETSDSATSEMTCSDFKRYIFSANNQAVAGTQNLLRVVFRALPSNTNLEFIGMIQALNGDAKLEDGHLASNPTWSSPEQQGSGYETSPDYKQEDIQRVPFTELGGFFAPLFRAWMDALVDHPEGGLKALVPSEVEPLKQNIAQSLAALDARSEEISQINKDAKYRDLKTKWNLFRALPQSAWTIQISWEWPSRDVALRDGSDPGVCELPHATSTITSSSTTSYKPTTTMTDSPTTIKSTVLTKPPTLTPIPCGAEECGTISCAGGEIGECLALPMGRGFACGCQPRTCRVSYTSTIVVAITAVTTTSRSPDSTPPKTSSTTSAPAAKWTQSCNVGGLRFDRETATGWVEEFCKDDNKKEWSDDKWFDATVDGKLVKTKGIEVFETDSEDTVSSYKFTIHVIKPNNNADGSLWCDTNGRGSTLASALEWLREDPQQYRISSTSCSSAGLCLHWTIEVRKNEE